MPTQIKDKIVVITGASAGIGASLAEVIAKRGGKPVLVARREKELGEVAARAADPSKAAALTIACDVTKRENVIRVREETIAKHGHIDVWVNNAGRGISRNATELTDEDIDEMMLVNLKSALYGMQAVLPHFRERNEGHIINVSSLLGRVPMAPVRSAYAASKHALNAITANFRMEVRATHPNIHVSTVSPGIVATDFGLNALHGGMDSRAFPYAQPVEDVAIVIADTIENPRADVYTRPGVQNMITGYFGAEDMAAAEDRFRMSPPVMFASPEKQREMAGAIAAQKRKGEKGE